MKTKNIQIKKLHQFVLISVITFIMISCNKSDLSTPLPGTNSSIQEKFGDHRPPNDHCLVTHTEDDLLGNMLDIFYNTNGDPDSMNFSGTFPINMSYNNGHLHSAIFGSQGNRFDFFYNGNSYLPSYADFILFGNLYATIHFSHDSKGRITQIEVDVQAQGLKTVETFQYNNKGNVYKADISVYNGGVLTLAYTQNEAASYDNKKNFMGGNHWLKYILYNSGVSILDYFRMFSKNNPIDYTWGYNGDFNPIHATYNYNNQGFANSINFNLLDTDYVTVLTSFTQLSLSTCDNNWHKQAQPASSKDLTLLQNKFTRVLPLTTKSF